jgi:hypothetical protein
MLDRAVLPPTHFPHRLFVNVQFALVALQSIMYVLVPRLPSPKFCRRLTAFQDVASRVQNLVIFSSSFGDGVFIGLLASISMVGLHLAHVRAFFFFFLVHTCAVADSLSSRLMEWAGQFAVSIIYHYIREHISRNSVGPSTSCSG